MGTRKYQVHGRRVLYRLFDDAGELLYIGITLHLGQRLKSHAGSKSWWPDVATVTQEPAPPYLSDAMRVERLAIAKERPRYNTLRTGCPATPQPTPDGKPLFVPYRGYRRRDRERCTICGATGNLGGAWRDSCRIRHGYVSELA